METSVSHETCRSKQPFDATCITRQNRDTTEHIRRHLLVSSGALPRKDHALIVTPSSQAAAPDALVDGYGYESDS
eukprot:578313-Pyramimonas_sp.AAC.1